MKRLFLVIALILQMNQIHAKETSECDGISHWKSYTKNSPDVMTRTCNLFGMNYVEIRSQLDENRCIAISNKKTGDQWKHFFLRKQSIKALGNPYFDPSDLVISSKQPIQNRCSS